MHFSVFIFQIVTLHLTGKRPGDIHALVFQQLAGELQPLCGIVVAADEKYCDLFLRQRRQKAVQHGHCLCRRDVFVIDIPGDQNRLHRLFHCDFYNLFQHFLLLRKKRMVIEPPSQMQVAEMQYFHVFDPFPFLL